MNDDTNVEQRERDDRARGNAEDRARANMDYDLRQLSLAPISLLNGWIELWRGFTLASQATLNLMNQTFGRAAEDLSRTMSEVRRETREVR